MVMRLSSAMVLALGVAAYEEETAMLQVRGDYGDEPKVKPVTYSKQKVEKYTKAPVKYSKEKVEKYTKAPVKYAAIHCWH